MVMGYSINAQGGLITIGTSTYSGSDYNLIWDDDNNGNFQNLVSSAYWSDTDFASNIGLAWAFHFGFVGYQYTSEKGVDGLAVRPGGVAAVLEPTIIALHGIGLAGLAGYSIRRRRQLR